MKLLVLMAIAIALIWHGWDDAYLIPKALGVLLLAVVLFWSLWVRKAKPMKCTVCGKALKRNGLPQISGGTAHRLCKDCNRRWEALEAYKMIAVFRANRKDNR
jgi:hypothetical protein